MKVRRLFIPVALAVFLPAVSFAKDNVVCTFKVGRCECTDGTSWQGGIDQKELCEGTGQQEQQQEQKSSGKQKSDEQIACEAAKGAVWAFGKCGCPAIDMEWIYDGMQKGCILTQKAKEIGAKQEACKSDDVKWNSLLKKCECKDATKFWDGFNCIKDGDIELCENAPDAKWNSLLKKCECKEPNRIWKNDKCDVKSEQREEKAENIAEQEAACKAAGESVAEWGNILKKCKCKDSAKEWDPEEKVCDIRAKSNSSELDSPDEETFDSNIKSLIRAFQARISALNK